MGHYKSNLRDIEFNLFEVLGRQDVLGTGPYADMDEGTARSILAEVERLATHELADSFMDADRNPPVFDPATSSVTLPESFKKSYAGVRRRRLAAARPAPGDRRHRDAPVGPLGDRRDGPRVQPGRAHVLLWRGLLARLLVARHARAEGVGARLRRARLGRQHGPDRARRRLRRRRRTDEGDPAGTTAAWHLEGVKRFITGGRARPDRQHRPPRARPPRRCRPGHQGPLVVHRTQVLRPTGRPAS